MSQSVVPLVADELHAVVRLTRTRGSEREFRCISRIETNAAYATHERVVAVGIVLEWTLRQIAGRLGRQRG